jgi:RNA polymerase sigma-70 factor, ECF subfamily
MLDNPEALHLLAAIARGDQAAYERLYRAVSRHVYAFVLQRCGDAALAEEIVVDTLVDVWKQPARFRGESKFSTWLLSIARFKMIDRLRASGPERDHDDIDTVADTLADDNSTDSAYMKLHNEQQRVGIDRCMARLSPEHREALHLVYFEDMAVAEVASLQGVPVGTVKTRLFNARLKIRDCLAALLSIHTPA